MIMTSVSFIIFHFFLPIFSLLSYENNICLTYVRSVTIITATCNDLNDKHENTNDTAVVQLCKNSHLPLTYC